jgi:hypothetical protein
MLEGSYDRNDSRTWYSKATPSAENPSKKRDRTLKTTESTVVKKKTKKAPPPPPPPSKPKRVIQHTVSEALVKSRASETVTCLLFSSHRAKRNAEAILEMERHAAKARNTYIIERFNQRQLPYLSDIYRLIGDIMSRALPLVEYVFDEGLHDYYVNVILQVWNIMVKHIVPADEKEYDDKGGEIVPRIDLDMVVLGTLYAMRQGLIRNCVALLPRDEFLLVSLPLIHETSFFPIHKKKIGRGITLLNKVYDSALADGVPADELMLDISKLPEKGGARVFKKLGGGGKNVE